MYHIRENLKKKPFADIFGGDFYFYLSVCVSSFKMMCKKYLLFHSIFADIVLQPTKSVGLGARGTTAEEQRGYNLHTRGGPQVRNILFSIFIHIIYVTQIT